jgi:hypothetical protein
VLRIAESASGFEQLNQVAVSLLLDDFRFRLDAEFLLDEVEYVYIDEGLPAFDGVAAIGRLQRSVGDLEHVFESGLEFEPGHEFNI